MISETHFPSLSLSLQEKLSELDGFRDFVFVISSILRIIVIGNVCHQCLYQYATLEIP